MNDPSPPAARPALTEPPLGRALEGRAAPRHSRGTQDDGEVAVADKRVDWVRVLPFLALHASCALVLVVGWSPVALGVAAALYFVRMFAITAFYHRYFSHRAFKTSRTMQWVFAVLGNSAVQRGPLWWAAHHRKHHRATETDADVHSPVRHGFLWSHVGWITSRANFPTDLDQVRDLARYRELRFLDRHDVLVPAILAALTFALGASLGRLAPVLGTSGPQMLVWGFCVSTVVLYHATFSINSLAHLFGRRRFETGEQSRNNAALALITLGEGWHNNHHHHPHSVRQGFAWWELDVTYLLLRGMERLGLVWDLRAVPADVLAASAPSRRRTR